MDLLKVHKLDFCELQKGEGLYDDVDIHAQQIVNAKYLRRTGYENNPDICALPKLMTNRELGDATTKTLLSYDYEEVKNMPGYLKKEALLQIQNAYYPLAHVFDMAYAVDAALVSSYMAREQRCSGREEILPSGQSSGNVYSLRNNLVGRAYSFLITGNTGCGKTVAMNQIKNLYPTAIYHKFDDYEYTQIPILVVTALVGNMGELLTACGGRIDEIMDTGTYYADQIRHRNVGQACNRLKQWIKLFHVGLIVIDEIQFMNFGTGNSSFENLVGIAEETGCALGLIGNKDANAKIYNHPRIVNRVMLNRIEIGISEEVDRVFFLQALKHLWEYQWTSERTELTEEIQNQLINDSLYNIAILKALLIRMQYEAIKKYPKGGITAEYIHTIAEKYFAEMRTLILQDTPAAERKVITMLQQQTTVITEDAKQQKRRNQMAAVEEINKIDFDVKNQAKLGQVYTILGYLGYTETQIKRALRMSVNSNPDLQYLDVNFIVDALKNCLDSGKPDTKIKTLVAKEVNKAAESVVKERIQNGV